MSFKASVKKSISALYAEKLKKSLGEGDSESKKIKKFRKVLKRFFKSPKNQTILKVTLIAFGMGVVLSNPHIRQEIVVFLSKCRKFFTSSDENINSPIGLEVSNKPTSNRGKLLTLLGLGITIVLVVIHLVQDKEVEVEVVPPSITTIAMVFIKDYRQPIGLLLFIASFPVMSISGTVAGVTAGVLQFTGWQLATAVF